MRHYNSAFFLTDGEVLPEVSCMLDLEDGRTPITIRLGSEITLYCSENHAVNLARGLQKIIQEYKEALENAYTR